MRLTTTVVLTVVPLAAVVALTLVGLGVIRGPSLWVAVLGLCATLLVGGIVVAVSWIQGYRLDHGALVVERLGRPLVWPLAGLVAVEGDRAALRHALRICGNDGVGAISGRFWSRRLGRFRAYVTDADNAVVLRWPHLTLVVSPDRPATFVAAVRRQADLES